MTSVFNRHSGHEQVVYCQDEASGLRAIIAIYSTALGPALGGTRFYPYASEADALDDVLNLARAMAYKAAITGLDLGGGKAVILGDPARDKSEALLRAYGRFVQSLGGRYITACDVGTYPPDMDIVARVLVRHRTLGRGRRRGRLGSAHGVRRVPGHARIGRAPVGRTDARWPARWRRRRRQGGLSTGLAADRGWRIGGRHRCEVRWRSTGCCQTSRRCRSSTMLRRWCVLTSTYTRRVPSVAPWTTTRCRFCRRGLSAGRRIISWLMVASRRCWRIAACLYAPDYVVNAGGLIQVADEVDGFSELRARARATRIYDTTRRVFRASFEDGVPPAVAADRLAERRMAEVGRLRSLWLR